MTLLPKNELPQYVPESQKMQDDDVTKYLARANSYCLGIIGGVPRYTTALPAETVKAAVGLAFEIFAEGQKAQTNPVNGLITEAAPTGHYVRKADNPLDVVNQMLAPYAAAYILDNITTADNGIAFY